MASAIPVHRVAKVDPEVKLDEVVPAVEAVVEAEPVKGKDHPVLGKWHGHGWHKSN